MARISFTKVENLFNETLRKMLIDRLVELATIVALIHDPKSKVPKKIVEDILNRFQVEFKRMQEQDPKLYEKLNLSKDDEKKILGDMKNATANDWEKLKAFKERLEELRGEYYGHEKAANAEDEAQIEKERRKHINKRFNIREGWLPLQ